MNDETKNVILSKTLWGVLISVIATVLAKYGVTIDQAVWVNDAVALVGVGLSIYGRVVATAPLTVVPRGPL